ncbi:hypothetical protein [Desulfovibrio desulfuricans]|uniref:hypothetical protein n=1 Tax=Desulfovibrio desulfuricans TaxID=876 RepID=UPI0039844958
MYDVAGFFVRLIVTLFDPALLILSVVVGASCYKKSIAGVLGGAAVGAALGIFIFTSRHYSQGHYSSLSFLILCIDGAFWGWASGAVRRYFHAQKEKEHPQKIEHTISHDAPEDTDVLRCPHCGRAVGNYPSRCQHCERDTGY